MLRTALASHGLTIGFAALGLLMPPAVMAQLPDAPSTVKARQLAEASVQASVDNTFIRDNPGLRAALENREFILTFDPGTIGPRATSSSATGPPESSSLLAFNMPAEEEGQQSLYTPPKQNFAPGFSSATAEQHPIPGAGPVLQNTCPKDVCTLVQDLMCCGPSPSPFQRYLKNPDVVPLTARDNLHSAVIHIIDPFNLMTIVLDSGIGIASDSHSVYGPGFDGFAKYAGVSLTEDMTGEFFGTFLIPSLVHQDPHYHREPYVSVKRRIWHAVTQVVWTQSYTGQPMFNYGNIVGGIATAVVSNTFVPGPNRQGFANTAQRLALAFAISPSGNLIEEFVPDVAHRINLRVVIFQRILNTVSFEVSGVP